MQEPVKFSIRRRIKSFLFAFNGIKNLIKNEHNARIHLVVMLVVIIFGFIFNITLTEWISIVVVIGLVLLSELFNTAIEKLSDIVDPKWNIKIGEVKDYSAAAVLISAVIAVIVGGIIFIPKIVSCLKV